MDLKLLKAVNEARASRRAVMVVRDLKAGRDTLVAEGDTAPAGLEIHVAAAFRSGKSGTVQSADGTEYFLTVHVPPARIVAIGAVHITQALAPLARVAGYDLEIIDPRTAFATPERFPDVKLFAEWPEDVLKQRPFDAYTAVAAVTHDPKIDDFALASALREKCFYVGALGSRKTHAKRVERLTALGATEAEVASIRAPIGLNIHASNPAEIAVAVLAEIIEAFRSRGLSTGADRRLAETTA